MKVKSKLGIGLMALFSFVGLLFNQPMLGLPKGQVFGVPAIIIYLLSTWIFVILILFYLAKTASKK